MLDWLFGRRRTPEERFWQWFASRQADYFALRQQDQHRLFAALEEELHRIHEDLTFQFGPVTDGRREFIISAGGIDAAFPAVDSLVQAAPDLPQWQVIAFVQRSPAKLTISYRSASLHPDKVLFAYEPVPGSKLDVILFADSFEGPTAEDAKGAAFLLLDTVLGEYDVATRLGGIDFRPLPESREGLQPLWELSEVVDRHFVRH